MQDFRSNLPFKLVAATEILTEAFLLELGVEQDIVRTVMERRDQLFRELTHNDNPNAPYVASMIREALADPSGLENAVFFGFKSLGFQTTKIGDRGKPDGVATATLGVCPSTKKRLDYSITYDAKSTKRDKIKAQDIKTAACVRHRKDYDADYSVVIAIDFEGSDNPDSAASKEAKQQRVTLIKANDFWKLVLIAIPNQLNYSDYRNLLENCHTVIETQEWIDQIAHRKIQKKPIRELLETTAELARKDTEPPNIHAVRAKNKELENHSIDDLMSLVRSLENLVPRLISIDKKGSISLETNPERIIESMNRVLENQIPPEYSDLFLRAFETLHK